MNGANSSDGPSFSIMYLVRKMFGVIMANLTPQETNYETMKQLKSKQNFITIIHDCLFILALHVYVNLTVNISGNLNCEHRPHVSKSCLGLYLSIRGG